MWLDEVRYNVWRDVSINVWNEVWNDMWLGAWDDVWDDICIIVWKPLNEEVNNYVAG